MVYQTTTIINSGEKTNCDCSSFPFLSQHLFLEHFKGTVGSILVAWWTASWWPDGQQSSEFLVLGNHGLMTSIMLWDRQNYFQTYEFELIRKWGFYLILTTEEQRGENFLKAFLLNGLCFLLSLLALTHISSDAEIFMHFRYHLMPQKLVWNRFCLFSLSTGWRIFPFQIGIWYWIFLLILKLGLPEKKKGKC